MALRASNAPAAPKRSYHADAAYNDNDESAWLVRPFRIAEDAA